MKVSLLLSTFLDWLRLLIDVYLSCFLLLGFRSHKVHVDNRVLNAFDCWNSVKTWSFQRILFFVRRDEEVLRIELEGHTWLKVQLAYILKSQAVAFSVWRLFYRLHLGRLPGLLLGPSLSFLVVTWAQVEEGEVLELIRAFLTASFFSINSFAD